MPVLTNDDHHGHGFFTCPTCLTSQLWNELSQPHENKSTPVKLQWLFSVALEDCMWWFCAASAHGSGIGTVSLKENIAMLPNWTGQPWMSDKLVSINCSNQQHKSFLCQSFCSLGGWAWLAPIVFGFVSEPLANNLITVRFFSTAQSCGFICW